MDCCKIKQWASFIGSIVWCCKAIQYGWLYTKEFERVKFLALLKSNNNYEAYMKLPENLQTEFSWCSKSLIQSVNLIRENKFKREIFSDASTSGRGGFCAGEEAHGFWTMEECKLHINYLELITTAVKIC